jgi:hypothetical protein
MKPRHILPIVFTVALIGQGCTETRGKDLTVRLPKSISLFVLHASLSDPAFQFDGSS